MKGIRILIGVGVWIALGYALWRTALEQPAHRAATRASAAGSTTGSAPGANTQRLAVNLWSYFTGPYPGAELNFEEPAWVETGDPIFVVTEDGGFQQIGELQTVRLQSGELQTSELQSGELQPGELQTSELQTSELQTGRRSHQSNKKCQALFYPTAGKIGPDDVLTYYQTPQSMSWVLETMLPPEKKRAIADEMKQAFKEHHQEILRELRPVIDASLREALVVIEQDLPPALSKRRRRFERLGARYQREIVEREIVPLVKREIWPIVRRHAEPAANEVGMEMWDRASLWSFAWRYTADKLPLIGNQNLLDKEWRRFVNDEAIPVLEDRTGEFIEIQKRILVDTARNKKVQQAVRKNFSRMVDDPQLRRLVWEVIDEVMVRNPRIQQVLDKHWRSPQAQRAFHIASQRLEPSIRRIGDLLLGTRENGISPEFASVLRNQILGKDKRWLVLERSDQRSSRGRAESSSTPQENSLVHWGREKLSPEKPAAKKLVLSVRRGHDWRNNPFSRHSRSHNSRSQHP